MPRPPMRPAGGMRPMGRPMAKPMGRPMGPKPMARRVVAGPVVRPARVVVGGPRVVVGGPPVFVRRRYGYGYPIFGALCAVVILIIVLVIVFRS
jgi:hypothetical protein